ncbi:DUF393 domain-containing protein [Snuella sp. CAU 1569]|uniref:DUF393 domain-containing protein n=2 Tax=Snuella sedimenti TaxID=2798802 RepID=A0A8J7IWR9_9FLAO|nr:DUF393 domain-containing protein [Snuella sedimenti]
MVDFPKHKKLILFDGVCNLCNASVQYTIKRDKHDVFRFAPLQSSVGKQIIETYRVDTNKTDSIILYTPSSGVSYKSTAALKIASQLSFPNNLMVIFLIVPAFIRNWFYDYIAKNRYRWYGKKDACMLPTPDLKSKFLE